MATVYEKYITNDDADGSIANLGSNEAQTFTIGNTGDNITFNVGSVDVKVKTNAGSLTLNFKIYNTLPDGTPDILSGVISQASIIKTNTGTFWINVPMSSGELKAGVKYALIMSQPDDSDTWWREDASSPTYTGGSHWFTNDGTETIPAWTQTTGADKMFRINGGSFQGTLCTFQDAINKAGANPNTVATNEDLVSSWVLQAEGTINLVTRFNFIDKYSTLNDDVKFVLNQIASDLAAIYIVQYDMNSYTSRIEAEDMVNILRDSSLRGLSLIRDKKQQEFIKTA